MREAHKRRLRPRNSAGRNLPAAIATGVILGVVVIFAMLIKPELWYPLVAIAIGVATWEVSSRLRENGAIISRWMLILTGQLMVWASYFFSTNGLVAVFVAAAMAIMVSRLFHHGTHTPPRNWLKDSAVSIMVLTWIPMFGTFAAMISQLENEGVVNNYYILTFIGCVVASDVGGYVFGVLFGTHPMAPAVSPKKSWEGLAGSLLLGVTVGIICVHFLLRNYWWFGIPLGVGLVVCATLGDLVESQFKRQLGIKDMAQTLPGHGGVMDRIDGLLPSAMVTWVILGIISNLPVPLA